MVLFFTVNVVMLTRIGILGMGGVGGWTFWRKPMPIRSIRNCIYRSR
jgi:predicted negative regulator of RcsB-dependent stress response